MAYKTGLTSSPNKLPVGAIYELAYKELVNLYRNEYIYKNAIAEKIIKGRHRLSKKCHFATEFRVFDSIADVVIANGTTTAYEIKTEYDSFDRLQTQLINYSKALEYVYVVIPESKFKACLNHIPNHIGIITLTKNYTLNTKRKALSNTENIDHNIVFSCLRRNEVINITNYHFGKLPDAKPVELKKSCQKLFLTLSKKQVHNSLLYALKARSLNKESIKIIEKGYSSLISLFLTINLSVKQAENLAEALESA